MNCEEKIEIIGSNIREMQEIVKPIENVYAIKIFDYCAGIIEILSIPHGYCEGKLIYCCTTNKRIGIVIDKWGDAPSNVVELYAEIRKICEPADDHAARIDAP